MRIIFIGLICVCFVSCFKEIQTVAPSLSQQIMVDVLTDIHLAESMLSEVKHRPTQDSMASEFYSRIFEIHQVEPAQFNASMNAYFSDPISLDSLYSAVILRIAEIKKLDLKADPK